MRNDKIILVGSLFTGLLTQNMSMFTLIHKKFLDWLSFDQNDLLTHSSTSVFNFSRTCSQITLVVEYWNFFSMFVVGHWALDENRWMNRDGPTTLSNKRKPPCIGGMELVSLSCNRVFISAESVGRGWCKIAIATKLIFDTKPLSKPMLWYCNEVKLRKKIVLSTDLHLFTC